MTTVEPGAATAEEPSRTAGAPGPGDGPNPLARWARPLTIGTLVAVGSTAAGALVAAFTSVNSPVAAIAGQVIDAVPSPVRKWAIRTFGTSDKLVLGIGIVVILTVISTLVAAAAPKRRWLVPLTITAFGLIGVVATDTTTFGSLSSAAASMAMAYLVFVVLLPYVATAGPRLVPVAPRTAGELVAEPMVIHRWEAPVDRRAFVARAGALWAGTAAMSGIAAGVNRSDNSSVVAARAKLPTIPAGSPDAAGVVDSSFSAGNGAVPFVTPNADFYRIDTSYAAPRVTLADWKLTIGGAVDNPLTLSYDDLLERHVVERYVTLCCVSNEVGGDLVGNARFLGVPLAELLEEAGVRPEGTQVAMTSVDGWTCGFPTELALDGRDAMVAIGMNGEPLPIEHGFPVRMVVPGLYGYVSATKWLTNIELTGLDDFDGYWIPRGWAKDGPVKTQSRIDVPARDTEVAAGTVMVAGIAFAQHRGVERVEVRIDNGPWEPAELAAEWSIDTWRQWTYRWDATPGSHRIAVRATDRDGETQTEKRTPVAPDGATGHHSIAVDVV